MLTRKRSLLFSKRKPEEEQGEAPATHPKKEKKKERLVAGEEKTRISFQLEIQKLSFLLGVEMT
jgi:hypothetical protein